MRIDVLGELRILDDAGTVRTLPGLAGDLLRLLLAEMGRPVPVPTITEVLWGDRPPRSATANMQTYVSRIRATLAAAGHGDAALVLGCGAYRLRVRPDQCDLLRFARLAERGRAMAGGAPGDLMAAVGTLRAATALWNGSPMTPAMRDRSVTAQGIAARFEEMHLRVYAGLVDAACRAGDPASVIGDLRRLVGDHPRRESVHALLLRALYESGDQAAALWAYHDVRRRLADELGVEPGHRLRGLYRTMLTGDRMPAA